MKNIIFIFIAICFWSCHHKNMPFLNESCKNLSEAIKTKDTVMLNKSLQIAYNLAENSSTKRHDSLIAVASRFMGNSLLDVQKNIAARIYYEKGLRFGLRQLSKEEEIIARLYLNIGATYVNLSNFQTALIYYDSVQIVGKEKSSISLKVVKLMTIAQCYNALLDYKNAEKFYQEAIPLAEANLSKNEIAALYNRNSFCLHNLKQYKQSIESGEKAISVLNFLQKEKGLNYSDSLVLGIAHFYIAYALKDSLQYSAADVYYQKALDIYKSIKDTDNIVAVYLNTSFMHRFDKQYEKSIKISTEGINLLSNISTSKTFLFLKRGELFINRSEVHLAKQDYQKAIADHDSAIYYLTQYDKNPTLTALLMNNRHSLLSVYADKAKALIALAEKGENREGGYQQALNLFEKIIDVSDDIRADYISDDAKLTLAENIKPAFEKAIGLCQSLYQKTQDARYLQQAFAFAEHSRSMILNENVRLNNQLPKDLQAENADLKKREADLVAKSNTDDLQVYLRMKRAFREKIKTYNHSKILSVSALQQTLLKDGKTALIEYFVGDSTLFMLTVTADSMHIQALPKSLDLDKTVLALRNAIVAENSAAFMPISTQLYHDLLPNWVQNGTSDSKIKRLILIPDGVLSYISFDMLAPLPPEGGRSTTTLSSNKDMDCLLKHYTISYAPSASFLMANATNPHKNTGLKNFMGFAPQYKTQDTVAEIIAMRTALTRDGAYNLPQAHAEVEQINNIVGGGGTTFVNEAADEKTFKTQAEKAKILHLAMHALSDNDNPAQSRLLFTKNKADTLNDNDLTVAELNTLTLKADLAVLSACNTGFGKLNKGEGVMSIARAFHAAGVPSTVMSLWKVPDTETSELMIDFYKNLKSGLPKDEALRQAKLNYLNHVKLDSKASPLYWSAFVLSGSTDVVDFETPLSIFAYLGIVLGGIAVLFVFLKYRKSLK